MTSVFALLDDSSAAAHRPGGPAPGRPPSRLYTGYSHQHRCTDPATLNACWAAVAADQQRGLHAVLLADYEWGARLVGAGCEKLAPADIPALRVLMFSHLAHLGPAEVAAWLREQDRGSEEPSPAGALNLQPSVSDGEFCAAIEAVQEAIRNGETYQVNYTYRLTGQAQGSPMGLYRRLRARQPVAYGAFIALPPDGHGNEPTHILSMSPELFLRHEAGLVTARPMKGTAGRLRSPESDSEAARLLQQDVKNRAENLMIVDLLRNDLGRIAQIGSVSVPALFAVEPYATVFQMTSTVQARLQPGTDMPTLLRATFPCGSITGAPKHHTMDLISRFESTPRGLYCGAIGWVDAPEPGSAYSSIGNFCLSVAIRTLTLGPVDAATGGRALRLGVGAGIVQDSVALDELEECRLKARFLTGLNPGFELFETMRVEAVQGAAPHIALRAQHLTRLQRSALALGFAFDAAEAERLLSETLLTLAATPSPHGAWRLRLSLAVDGHLTITHAPLPDLALDEQGGVSLVISPHRLPNANPLSRHKTTLRNHYDAAIRDAEAQGAFDALFFAEDGRLAEGARSSVFVQLNGEWFTPPLADGALPGVCRGQVLQDGLWGQPVVERPLNLRDVQQAETLALGNALRGVMLARLQ
ncbi:MAG: bifunctional anthranilate synthase component I family protein/class IV aminotransferase [Vitreoscilla sp.]|nr:bifunctional anthranilate synthase component I family protein/class IV aminotransferase [Vitreoscilla sp.]